MTEPEPPPSMGPVPRDAGVPVRQATKTDLPAVSSALAGAFHDDPVMGHFFPQDLRQRDQRLARFMGVAVDSALVHDSVFTTAERAGAAVWLPPGHWKLPLRRMLTGMPGMLRALGRRVPVAMAALSAIEAQHPTEPHWYLEILGTEPASQGKGIGGALMAPILERCDGEGVPAHLESSKERNIPYYERHGFRVTGEIDLPKGGPRIWPMWRDPR